VFSQTINEAGQVDYRDVISSLNWRHHPVLPPVNTTVVGPAATRAPASEPAWQGNDACSQLVQVVRADALVQDLSA